MCCLYRLYLPSLGVPQEAMPNHVKMALPAGSAFLFDSSVWVSYL